MSARAPYGDESRPQIRNQKQQWKKNEPLLYTIALVVEFRPWFWPLGTTNRPLRCRRAFACVCAFFRRAKSRRRLFADLTPAHTSRPPAAAERGLRVKSVGSRPLNACIGRGYRQVDGGSCEISGGCLDWMGLAVGIIGRSYKPRSLSRIYIYGAWSNHTSSFFHTVDLFLISTIIRCSASSSSHAFDDDPSNQIKCRSLPLPCSCHNALVIGVKASHPSVDPRKRSVVTNE